jgi:hypothetical protein
MRLGILVAFFVCSSGCSRGSGEFQTIEIKALGVSVQAPADWKLEEQGPGQYSVRGSGRSVTVAEIPASFATSDELATACDVSDGVFQEEELPKGGIFTLCKHDESGRERTRVKAALPTSDEKAVFCGIDTDTDPALEVKICRTLARL